MPYSIHGHPLSNDRPLKYLVPHNNCYKNVVVVVEVVVEEVAVQVVVVMLVMLVIVLYQDFESF